MTDQPRHLRLVADAPSTNLAAFHERTNDLLAEIDRLVDDLVTEGAIAGPEALVHAHKQLGMVAAIVSEAKANAAEAIHRYIQDHGELVGGATTYRSLEIGGTLYKAKADRGSPSMTAANAHRMWAQVQACLLSSHNPADAARQVQNRIAEGDDLDDAVGAVCQAATADALRTIEDVYPVTTGGGGKAARKKALADLGLDKDRYLTFGAGNVTLTFEAVSPVAAEALAAEARKAVGQ